MLRTDKIVEEILRKSIDSRNRKTSRREQEKQRKANAKKGKNLRNGIFAHFREIRSDNAVGKFSRASHDESAIVQKSNRASITGKASMVMLTGGGESPNGSRFASVASQYTAHDKSQTK